MSDQNKMALCAVTSEILRELDKRIMELVRLDLKKGRHPTQGLRIGSVGRDFFILVKISLIPTALPLFELNRWKKNLYPQLSL